MSERINRIQNGEIQLKNGEYEHGNLSLYDGWVGLDTENGQVWYPRDEIKRVID